MKRKEWKWKNEEGAAGLHEMRETKEKSEVDKSTRKGKNPRAWA
jgi:hypothetical protein